MNKSFLAILAAGAIAAISVPSHAQQLIGSLSNRPGDPTNYYKFQNNGITPPNAALGGNFYTTTNGNAAGMTPVLFTFNVGNTPFANPFQANLGFYLNTDELCGAVGTDIRQSLAGGTIRVFVDPNDPTYGAQYGGQEVLTAAFANATLEQPTVGADQSPRFISADPGDVVSITSPYVQVTDPERIGFSFSSGSVLSCDAATGIMNAALLGGTGNFAARSAQGLGGQEVPEPGAVAMLLGTGVAASLTVIRRRNKK
jgi:hypothetical protein